MVAYHLLFDLEFLFGLPLRVTKSPLLLLARTVATLFILLLGVSAVIKFERIRSGGIKRVLYSFGKKALSISVYAMLITLVTYLIFPDSFIVFGILHFVALSLFLIIPFLYLRSISWVFLWSLIFLGSKYFLQNIKTTTNLFLPFGVTSYTFYSFDYFPLFPWFGIALIGTIIARTYFIPQRIYLQSLKVPNKIVSLVSLSGRHSLTIYLTHQPILFAVLSTIKSILIAYNY